MNREPIIKLVYCSRASELPSPMQLDELLGTARSFNAAHNVSGILLYKDGSFFQYLEGEREVVEALFERIKRDKRHYAVRLLLSNPINERVFNNWQMGFYEPSMDAIKLTNSCYADPLQTLDKKLIDSTNVDFNIETAHKLISTFLLYA